MIEKYLVDTGRIAKPLRHLLTMLVVVFGWVLFKFEDMGLLGTALKGMFGLNGNAFTAMSSRLLFSNNYLFLIFCIIAVTPLGKTLVNMVRRLARENTVWLWVHNIWDMASPVLLLFISMMALAGDSYNPFLYFQF